MLPERRSPLGVQPGSGSVWRGEVPSRSPRRIMLMLTPSPRKSSLLRDSLGEPRRKSSPALGLGLGFGFGISIAPNELGTEDEELTKERRACK